jgi:N-acetylglucosamine transport system permease protein
MDTASAPTTTTPPAPARSENPRRIGGILVRILIYLFLIAWAIVVIYPMAWTVMGSLRTDRELLFTPWGLPTQLHFENYLRAWKDAQIGQFFGNTLIVIIPSLFFTLLFSAMVAYVLARYEFRGRQFIFYLFLGGMMFPIILAMVPLYFIMEFLHIRNTFPGLSLVYVAFSFPFTVFFLYGFFRTLPRELMEAAIIDGASHSQTFFRVMLPLAQPGLVTAAIFNFLGQWNQFILPSALMDNTGLKEGQTRSVLSQGLYYLQIKQQYTNDWSGMFAAVAIVMIPTLIVYVIFQNRIEKGLTVGALKG